MFRAAGTAEIIRSHQKDDILTSSLRSRLAELVQTLAGPRIWLHWRQCLDVTADVAYFLLTTCCDLQTVGEEYVNIIQTDNTFRALPSKFRRALMVFMQVCLPYILHSSISKLQRQVQSSPSISLSPQGRESVLTFLNLTQKAVTLIHRCHLALFYIKGIFYHLGKRFSGIHYIQYMSKERGSSSLRPFRILGYLSLLQLTASLLLQLSSLIIALREQNSTFSSPTLSSREEETENLSVAPTEKCPLCLGRRRQSTLTPCGHLYCWSCIHEWCQNKPECPLCRDQFLVHRLIALQNFDPPVR